MPVAYQSLPKPGRRRSDFALPAKRFLFIQVVDSLSTLQRANLIGLTETFRRAFPTDLCSRPGLVICKAGSHQASGEPEDLKALANEDEGVFVVDKELSRQDVAAVITLCDAAVTLHRVNGTGMFVAEAMLLGRPVIATDYSATTDLVTPATGFPVDHRLVPVAPADYCLEGREDWAEPDLDHAAWLMRRLVSDPTEAQPHIVRGLEHLNRNYSLEHVAGRQLARFREINFNV